MLTGSNKTFVFILNSFILNCIFFTKNTVKVKKIRERDWNVNR